MPDFLPDHHAREQAATVTDRNIVVTAGAGTGKTTLLVDRMLHLLFRQPDPLLVGDIVALTFTNKAANEMKVRLRKKLMACYAQAVAGGDEEPLDGHGEGALSPSALLERRYQLTAEQVRAIAGRAIEELERSQIGTIHGFAAHLLRLYPLESGVDPGFQEDDGSLFSRYFEQEWQQWLEKELSPSGAHRVVWRAALGKMDVDDIREFAWALTDDLIPCEEGAVLDLTEAATRPIQEWAKTLAGQGRDLRMSHEKSQTLERMLDEAIALLIAVSEHQVPQDTARTWLERSIPPKTKSWSDGDHRDAVRIIRVAQALLRSDSGCLADVVHMLIPFALHCRQGFVQSGWVSFNGLLARARNLLRDHLDVRRELKRQYGALLVDEFQDTDPVQYELILYLAESLEREATHWRDVEVSPGKLFIVGDPKQSIYAFRRADMEAYDLVVDNCVLGQGRVGDRYALEANFRSHRGLLDPINACFAVLFPDQTLKGIQPAYDPLQAMDQAPPLSPEEGMEIRLVKPEGDETQVDRLNRLEAEDLARWLSTEVLGRQRLREEGGAVTVKPKDVAVLFRTLTSTRVYVEAFRRWDIPYIIEGEKHFYERQEIIDFVNVLRAIVYPHDQLALVGVLRSAMGGLSDSMIAELADRQVLAYQPPPESVPDEVKPVYALLHDLHQTIPLLPLCEIGDYLLNRVPLLDYAAASVDGEQAMANLVKMRDIVGELARQTDMTLKKIVTELTERIHSPPAESERSLVEDIPGSEDVDGAVRILSIHRAKGLEFPMVVVAGLHRGIDSRESRVAVHHDWSSGIVGMKLGELRSIGSVYIADLLARRQEAEQVRLLYVALTRAKRRLVISSGFAGSQVKGTWLSFLGQGLGVDWDTMLQHADEHGHVSLRLGEHAVSVKVVIGREPSFQSARTTRFHGKSQEPCEMPLFDDEMPRRWDARSRRYEECVSYEPFVTVTAWRKSHTTQSSLSDSRLPRGEEEFVMSDVGGEDAASADVSAGRRHGAMIGTLAHKILEEWDFKGKAQNFDAAIDTICRRFPPAAIEDDRRAIIEALQAIFRVFVNSDPYARLAAAEIVGREIPFSIPWHCVPGTDSSADGRGSVMEGTIDLIYRLDGNWWLVDYKTDAVEQGTLQDYAAKYHEQLRIYRKAAMQGLQLTSIHSQVIFLRYGMAVELSDQG